MIEKPGKFHSDFSYISSSKEETIGLLPLHHPRSRNSSEKSLYNKRWSGFAARLQFRLAFAFVEGVLFRCRYVILAYHQEGIGKLKPEEILSLKELTLTVDESGKVKLQKGRTSFIASLKFILRKYSQVVGKNGFVDFGGTGFESLSKSSEVRDRLTHPKHRTDMVVQAAEIAKLLEGIQWFDDIITSLIGANEVPDRSAHSDE